MECKKPYYDVGFWEVVCEGEESRYMVLVLQKAKRLKVLEAKDLFALPEQEAKQVQRQISAFNEELQALYGYKLFAAEMRNCYSDSIDKVYNAYSERNKVLELENHQLKQENIRLVEGYKASIDETLFFLNFLTELLQKQQEQNEHSR